MTNTYLQNYTCGSSCQWYYEPLLFHSVPALLGTTASSVVFCRLMLIVRAGLFGCFRNPLNPNFKVCINTYSNFVFVWISLSCVSFWCCDCTDRVCCDCYSVPCLAFHFDVVLVTETVCHCAMSSGSLWCCACYRDTVSREDSSRRDVSPSKKPILPQSTSSFEPRLETASLWHGLETASLWYRLDTASFWHRLETAGLWHRLETASLWHRLDTAGLWHRLDTAGLWCRYSWSVTQTGYKLSMTDYIQLVYDRDWIQLVCDTETGYSWSVTETEYSWSMTETG